MEQTSTPIHTIQPPKENFFKEFFTFLIIALAIALPFRFFIAQPFIVSGSSMEPTFLDKEYLVVDEITYRFHEPQRGDVVIFKYPLDTSKYFIKRIVGLPGEHVVVEGTRVIIYNKENPQGFELSEPYIKYPSTKTSNITLKDDEYFTMGDNRDKSLDSRYWGPMPKKDLVGRAILRLFPPSKIGIFPGKITFDK
ncbi:MAG: signal peptidase I [bacterium]